MKNAGRIFMIDPLSQLNHIIQTSADEERQERPNEAVLVLCSLFKAEAMKKAVQSVRWVDRAIPREVE